MCLSVHPSLLDIMLRMTPKEFMKHYKEFRGVLGQASQPASKQASKQASRQGHKHLEDIQLKPCPAGAVNFELYMHLYLN